ncbi:MAG TPA: aminotransferase class I/II-fold pyridoxal phosphate-dependent enzyme [Thermoanaerobaculia bacterium]|jgi:pyridoxal phosphate-dependent aminotransferase EpsN
MPTIATEPALKRIYLSSPHMGEQERSLLLDAFDSNWVAPLGPHVDAFEREIAEYLGVRHAAALSSGTAALHLSLIIAGIGPGDVVLCSDLTFSASANPILYCGAEPVFIDSTASSWNMDPDLLEEELEACARAGRLPKAVIAVDLYGQSADYERIGALCERYGVLLIEDAAEALGATYGNRKAGTFGAMAILSFNGNKIITTAGGGMLVSDDPVTVERARFLATQARDKAPHYQHSVIGYNYRLSNLLAAVGRGQLLVLEQRVDARRRNFDRYAEAFRDLPGISFMPEAPYGKSNRWLTVMLVDPREFGASREDLRLALERENIEARPVWKPMHMQPVFAGARIRGGKVSESLFDRGLCLPSGSNLTDDDLDRVIDIVRAQRGRGRS